MTSNLTAFVLDALLALHRLVSATRLRPTSSHPTHPPRVQDDPSAKGLLQSTQRDALTWLAAARGAPAAPQQRLLMKYAMALLTAAPLRDAPTARTWKTSETESPSPLAAALRDLLILDSPALPVSVATVARAFAMQFGAAALERAVGESLGGGGAAQHVVGAQHVTRMLDLALVLLRQGGEDRRCDFFSFFLFSVSRVDRTHGCSAESVLQAPMVAAALRVACTSTEAAHQIRVCRVLAVAYGQHGDRAAADRLLDLLTLERDTVRVYAAMAIFDGVLEHLERGSAAAAAADDDDGLAVYPRDPIEILKFAMQFRSVDDSLAHVCAVAAMRVVQRVGERARKELECEALISVVGEYLISLRHARKSLKKDDRDARAATIEQWLRALDAPATRLLVADAVAYYVVGKHDANSKPDASGNKENAAGVPLLLDAHEREVARALVQFVNPLTHKPIIECILVNVGVADADTPAATKWLQTALFGAKKRKPLEQQQQ